MEFLARYWQWTTNGSRWRLAAGIGGPAFILLVALSVVFGEEKKDEPRIAAVQLAATPRQPAQPFPPVATSQATPLAVPAAATAIPPAPTAPAPSPTTAPPAAQTYRVVSGDNPTAIAGKLNVPTSERDVWVAAFLALNATTAGALQVGQELRLPPTTRSASAPSAPPNAPAPAQAIVPAQQPSPAPAVIAPQSAPARPSAPAPTPRAAAAPVQPTVITATGGQGCHPSYVGGIDVVRGGCIRANAIDYDCEKGGGDGPYYVRGVVKIVGPDEYGLDRPDIDGTGCEP